MQITDEVTADGKAKNADFELAEPRQQSDSDSMNISKKKLSN
jgi:hypothetical protein